MESMWTSMYWCSKGYRRCALHSDPPHRLAVVSTRYVLDRLPHPRAWAQRKSLHVDSRSGGTACIPSLGFRPSEGIHTHSTSLNLLASQPLLTVPARHQPVWCTFPT